MKYILALGIGLIIIGCGGPSEESQKLTEMKNAPANPNAKEDTLKAMQNAPVNPGESQTQAEKHMLLHRPGL